MCNSISEVESEDAMMIDSKAGSNGILSSNHDNNLLIAWIVKIMIVCTWGINLKLKQ